MEKREKGWYGDIEVYIAKPTQLLCGLEWIEILDGNIFVTHNY